jgi:hypothetical protein
LWLPVEGPLPEHAPIRFAPAANVGFPPFVTDAAPGLKVSKGHILLKNSKIAVSNIFAIGAKYRKPPLNWRCHINISKSKYRSFSKRVLLDFNDLGDFNSYQKGQICQLMS